MKHWEQCGELTLLVLQQRLEQGLEAKSEKALHRRGHLPSSQK